MSVDYPALVASVHDRGDLAAVGVLLLDAVGDRYAENVDRCALQEFEQSGAHYLFDLAGLDDLPQEDRTVAAWALTPGNVERRDTAYQRGFPMVAAADDERGVDRGHLIPHLSGGRFGPNIFRQDRALNRGWSVEGKRYRALERRAAAVGGTLFFGHLIYDDDSAYPSVIEIAVVGRDGRVHADAFVNKPA